MDNCQTLGFVLIIFAILYLISNTEGMRNIREYADNVMTTMSPVTLLPSYEDASNFVNTTLPSPVLNDSNFIYSDRQDDPIMSRTATKIQYYDLRNLPASPIGEVDFNNSPFDGNLTQGRLNPNI
jgi:hypothetical protein